MRGERDRNCLQPWEFSMSSQQDNSTARKPYISPVVTVQSETQPAGKIFDPIEATVTIGGLTISILGVS